MIGRLARGAYEILLGLALVAGLGMVGAYFYGEHRGAEVMRLERNDHWQGIVSKLQGDHATALQAETRKARAKEDEWLANILKVGEALAKERARNAALQGDLSAALARERVRSAAATRAATGGRTEAEDTVAAARDRAAALGRSLDDALRAHEVCSGELEGSRMDTRALLAAWPRDSDEVASREPTTEEH